MNTVTEQEALEQLNNLRDTIQRSGFAGREDLDAKHFNQILEALDTVVDLVQDLPKAPEPYNQNCPERWQTCPCRYHQAMRDEYADSLRMRAFDKALLGD